MATQTTAAPVVERRLFWGLKWTGSQIGWQLLTKLVRALVLPKFLSPAAYGLYASLRLPLSYKNYTDIGVRYQLIKQLPQVRSQQGAAAFESVASTGGAWMMLTAVAYSLVLFVLALRQRGPHAWFYRPGFEILGFVLLFSKLEDFLGIRANSLEDFRQSGVAGMWRDTAGLVASIVLVILMGPIGPVVGICVGEALCVYYYLRRGSLRWLRLQLSGLGGILRGSIPLFAIALLDTALLTLDQLFVLAFLSKAQFGIYALGGFVATILLAISGVFLIIQPRLMRLEAESRPRESREVMEAALLLYLLLAVLAIVATVPAISLGVLLYLPKYRLGIPVYALFSALAILRGSGILLRPFFIARNQEAPFLRIEVSGVGVALLLNGLAWWMGAGLAGYCLASLGTYAVTMALMLFAFERQRLAACRRGKYLFTVLGLGIVAAFYFALRRAFLPGILLADIARLLLPAGIALLLLLSAAWLYRAQIQSAYRLFMREAV